MSTHAPDVSAGHSTQVENTTPKSRVIIASLVGTTIEFYDFYIYATAAVAVFPVLFFASKDDTTAFLPGSRPGRRMVGCGSARQRICRRRQARTFRYVAPAGRAHWLRFC